MQNQFVSLYNTYLFKKKNTKIDIHEYVHLRESVKHDTFTVTGVTELRNCSKSILNIICKCMHAKNQETINDETVKPRPWICHYSIHV